MFNQSLSNHFILEHNFVLSNPHYCAAPFMDSPYSKSRNASLTSQADALLSLVIRSVVLGIFVGDARRNEAGRLHWGQWHNELLAKLLEREHSPHAARTSFFDHSSNLQNF